MISSSSSIEHKRRSIAESAHEYSNLDHHVEFTDSLQDVIDVFNEQS